MASYTILLSITMLSTLVCKSSAIHCFYCNSSNNSACLDPNQFDSETRARLIPIVNCDDAVPRVEELRFFCRKIVQTIYRPHRENDLRVTRGCGWVRHEKPCYHADSRDHLETACQCFTDYCNSAETLDSNAATVLFISFAAILYFYR